MYKLGWTKTILFLCLVCVAKATGSSAQSFTATFTLLHSFDVTDGANPFAGLAQATNGDLYGTTYYGGANGKGTIFKTSPSGTFTTLYSFCAQSGCMDGSYPAAALVQGLDGNLYGTTQTGGAYASGTVFKITPGGALTTLYSFCHDYGVCSDGFLPSAALVQGIDGNFYGTTTDGGTGSVGTVFKITPGGTLTTLHTFDGTDGSFPSEALVQGSDGEFYGTAIEGGATNAGTVFKVGSSGTFTTLYSLCQQTTCADGANPLAGLVEASDGNFYGTTGVGGTSGFGTVFKITPGGTLTTLYSFCSEYGCGSYPVGTLALGTDGNFYGVTRFGGNGSNGGLIFKITRTGVLTTLYDFCSQNGCADGYSPYAGLVQDTNGILYGTTCAQICIGEYGGYGTVFSLNAGLRPFVEPSPTSGKVGAKVTILGNNLKGTTGVTFNGTSATFTVNGSGTAITTAVPTGATSGKVEVTTPGGTLVSNVPFRVR